jgi:hypothetical protein
MEVSKKHVNCREEGLNRREGEEAQANVWKEVLALLLWK